MSEGFSSSDYGSDVNGVDMGGIEAATVFETPHAAQTMALSEEDLAEIVARTGTVPEIAKYIRRPAPPLLVVLTGPSGVGKDVTLERMEELGVPFHYAVTVTTRKQRPGEINGKHYFFVSNDEYDRMDKNGELLEHAEIYGNRYGIPRSQVVDPLRRGKDVIIKPDVQGAQTLRKKEPEAVFIFLAPPSMEEQARRLYYRKTEDPQELATRLEVARQEMHELTHFDYLVVNHSNRLDETVHTIEAILQAEKCRVHPRRIRLAEEP
ncbi:MAG: guanylate kinase [Chloroflexia bacterium]|jgi:guanylate kinase